MKRTTIFLSPDDANAVQTLMEAYGFTDKSTAIRYAIRFAVHSIGNTIFKKVVTGSQLTISYDAFQKTIAIFYDGKLTVFDDEPKDALAYVRDNITRNGVQDSAYREVKEAFNQLFK